MVTPTDSDTNVITFAHPAQVAAGRSRKAATVVILKKLRRILSETELRPSRWDGLEGEAVQGQLMISFHRVATGVCFRIDGPDGGAPLMSGYIDPQPPGQYADGKLHVMGWRRGWEASLF